MRRGWVWGVVTAIVCALGAMHEGCGTDSSGIGPTPTDDGGTDDSTTGHTCGNGIVEIPEQCDNGSDKNINGSGCDNDCSFSCTPTGNDPGLTKCAMDPCMGPVTCTDKHTCDLGQPKPDGTPCGSGKVCRSGMCSSAVCGDGLVEAGEECDDGNSVNGDGCDATCKFSCVSNDPTRNCTPSDPCKGQGTCNDATHKCMDGTPEPDGTMCPNGVCKNGTCVPASCGDGIVEQGEDCDFGKANGAGSGCETNCKFSCTKSPDSCVTTDLCKGTNACTTITGPTNTPGQKCVLGSPPPDGTNCGNGGKCMGGTCQTATCGNGTVDQGEQCDFGMGNNVAGSGCEPDCQFSCQTNPDTCPNADPCSTNHETCGQVSGPNGGTGQKCASASTLAMCAACASGAVCVSNQCKSSQCGDGCVDPAKGETCEPPNTPTCDSLCHTIKCGDGVRSGTEQCDDGNLTNLDGCDSTCHFEQDQRANTVKMSFTAPSSLCGTPNALGAKAIAGAAQNTVQTSLTNGVNDGSTTIMLKFMGIPDLTGTTWANAVVGGLGGVPVMANGKTYNGASDVEWWYTTDPNSIDGSRNPKTFLNGSIVSKTINVSGTIDLGINLGGMPTVLHMSGTKLRALVGNVSTPKISADMLTPGHLASEHLDPALQSFETMGNGELCGNISALSLSTVPIPAALLPGGSNPCNEGYTSSQHLLDVLVGGCTTTIFRIAVINKTQPDQVDPAAPPAGAGGLYTLVETGSPPAVTGCQDKNKASVNLQTCLAAAAYSSDFTFTTDRVIAK